MKLKNAPIICFCFSFVIFLWVLSWHLIDDVIYKEDASEENIEAIRGSFGDKFGSVNALFSGLAFAGVLLTLIFQVQESKRQHKQTSLQRFENTLFKMLSFQEDITQNLSYKDKNNDYKGREVFEKLYEGITITYNNKRYNYGIKEVLERENIFEYSEIKEITRFDHYFRHLYHIYKYIDESELLQDADNERRKYASIVRSHLSDYELILLFYNGISPNGKDKFKPLIEKYAIFNNLREDFLVNEENDLNKYDTTAYGNEKSSKKSCSNSFDITNVIFYLSESKGTYNPKTKEFTILKGSKISKFTAPSYPKPKMREELLNELTYNFIMKDDHTFPSPSAAAKFCTGYSVSGLKAWKDENYRTLGDIINNSN